MKMKMNNRVTTTAAICLAAFMWSGEAAAAICPEGNIKANPNCVAVEIYYGDREFAALNGCSFAAVLDVDMENSNSGGRYVLRPNESVQIDYSDEQDAENTDAKLEEHSFTCCDNVNLDDGQVSSCG